MAMGNYRLALDDYNMAIELEPSEASYYLNRANCKVLLGDKAGAKQDADYFKNPVLANSAKKSIRYYDNRYAHKALERKPDELLALLDSALTDYPNYYFAIWAIILELQKANDINKIQYFVNKYEGSVTYGHCFKAMQLLYHKDTIGAGVLIRQALGNGLSLDLAKT